MTQETAIQQTDFTFGMLCQQAEQLGYDEVVVILSNSDKSGPVLTRIQIAGVDRTLEVLDELSTYLMETNEDQRKKVASLFAAIKPRAGHNGAE